MWKSPKYHAFEGFFVGNARLGVWGGHIVIDKSGAWNVDNVTGFNNLVKISLLQTANTLTLKMELWCTFFSCYFAIFSSKQLLKSCDQIHSFIDLTLHRGKLWQWCVILELQLSENYIYKFRKNILFQLNSIPFTLSASVLL